MTDKIELRDYQKVAVNKISKILNLVCPVKAYCFVLPTGSGKSVIIAASIKKMLKKNPEASVLVCSWSRMIVEQDREKTDIMCKGKYDVEFHTVQELDRREATKQYDMIIVDECHKMYVGTAGYKSITVRMKNSNGNLRNPKSETVVLGFTATPFRSEHESVINPEMFVGVDDIIGYNELIRNNYLTKPTFIKGSLFQYDRTKLKSDGDFTVLSMEAQCKRAIRAIAEMVVNVHESGGQKVRGHATLVFLPSIRIVNEVEARIKKLTKVGVAVITGETEMSDREEAVKSAPIILNCGTMTTGVDITRVTSVVVCRATKSWVLWKQIVGRGLRLHNGKSECYIVDCGGNVELFGADMDAMPSITDAQVSGLPIMSECQKCHRYIPSATKICPYCGNVLRTDEEIHAAQLYKLYFDGGLRPVDSYSIEKRNIPGRGIREVLDIKMKIGRKSQFVFSSHPYSQEKKKEYLEVLEHCHDEGSTLLIRVEKVKGFETIVDAKLVNMEIGL